MATVEVSAYADFIRPDGEPNGSSPSKGTILSYFGGDPAAFDAQFRDVGTLITHRTVQPQRAG